MKLLRKICFAIVLAIFAAANPDHALAEVHDCTQEEFANLPQREGEGTFPGSWFGTQEEFCNRLEGLIQSLRLAQNGSKPILLDGRSELRCRQINLVAFEGVALNALIPEALPPETRVLFGPVKDLEHRPNRLTLLATREGHITHGHCG